MYWSRDFLGSALIWLKFNDIIKGSLEMWIEQTCFSQFPDKCCSKDGGEAKIGCVHRDKGKRRRWRGHDWLISVRKADTWASLGDRNKLTHAAAELWEDSWRELWGSWENKNLGVTLKQNEVKVYLPQLDPFPYKPENPPHCPPQQQTGKVSCESSLGQSRAVTAKVLSWNDRVIS